MFKKIIAAVIAANMCFSSLAYAQYQPVEEFTAEEIELYMTSLDEGGKVEKGLPPAAVVAGGAAAALGFAYAVRKISKNPELGKYFVMSQDPRAYKIMMNHAAKRAATPAAKAAVTKEAAREAAAMAKWNQAMTHNGMIKKINRGNYWRSVGAMMSGNPTAANRHIKQMRRGAALLKKPTASVAKNSSKLWRNAKRAGKWGLFIAAIGYIAFGGEDEENVTINNNRNILEREINRLMKEDVDSLALFVYNLPDDQRKVAYGILSENPDIYAVVKKQVEEALSDGNINAMIEYYEASEDAVSQENIDSIVGYADELDAKEKRTELKQSTNGYKTNNNGKKTGGSTHPRAVNGYIWPSK